MGPIPLETSCTRFVQWVDLEDYDLEEIQEILDEGGIDHYYLFPDLANLARSLDAEFRR